MATDDIITDHWPPFKPTPTDSLFNLWQQVSKNLETLRRINGTGSHNDIVGMTLEEVEQHLRDAEMLLKDISIGQKKISGVGKDNTVKCANCGQFVWKYHKNGRAYCNNCGQGRQWSVNADMVVGMGKCSSCGADDQ